MKRGFFITGTDTEVGKTILSAAIILALRSRGIKTGAMKPIETGCVAIGKTLQPSDGAFLKNIAQMDDPINHITPICFELPLAPLVASELEGKEIDLQKIRDNYSRLTKRYDFCIVEGVGGLLVPIKKEYSVLNLVREFGLPIIVVARASLGTINHTLLTVNYALKEGLRVAGIVINFCRAPDGSIAESTNPKTIQQLTEIPVIGVFPYLETINKENLERAALKHLDLETLIHFSGSM